MNTYLLKILHSFLIAHILVLFPFDTSLAKDFNDSESKHIAYPSWFKETPFYELAEDLGTARSDGKYGLMILFTTEGCSYCDLFIQKSLGNPEIAAIVQKNFDSVGLEIFSDIDVTDPRGIELSMKEFAKREGVQYSPTLLFYGKDGERVLRVIGYQSPERFRKILDYVMAKNYRTESLGVYFKRLAKKETTDSPARKMKQDPIFGKPPYILHRNHFPASQPLLVIFEQAGCNECNNFHNAVLALKEVRDTLKKFEVVRFDATDNKTPILAPDGNRTTPASWFGNTAFSRVPALVFFDENGNEVLKTDALVKRQRMLNSMFYVLERAYKKDWSYQRFARSKAIERRLKKKE